MNAGNEDHTMIYLLILLCSVLPAFSQDVFETRPITLEELVIEVPAGASREIGYTNTQAGVLYMETNGRYRSGWQGWRIMSTEMMKSYALTLDGTPLRPADAVGARAYPHQLVREYAGGAEETVTLLDSINVLAVEVRHRPGQVLEARPFFADAQSASDVEMKFDRGVLEISKKRHPARSAKEDYPVWLALTATGARAHGPGASVRDGSWFSPGSLAGSGGDSVTVIVFAWGDSRSLARQAARNALAGYAARVRARKERMERLLNDSYIRTNDVRLDKALDWAKLSLDALVMNQVRRGIFAGLPWFDNYWGRDTFIALPGATLVTGRFAEAKEILRSFAAWQSRDARDPNYGRIPNLVTTASRAYNTADGTPRFIIALDAYRRASGDSSIIREMYPVVKRSIEGTIQYHTDSLAFLTHGDAESWMDAVGPSGAWSPRGNRANDVQALWSRQLEIGARWADATGDIASARGWRLLRSMLIGNFRDKFVDARRGVVADHLNSDGSPDGQFRPNQLFTLDLLEEAGKKGLAVHVFDSVTRTLVYPHGVASLSQDDPSFHPYHHYPPYYVQDAAYHNGIVWTWLAGAWIDRALEYERPDLASVVTQKMVGQILDRGAIGTLSELLDAAPRPGDTDPRLSGTFSQAWSLAEFLRSFYAGYLGIDANAPERTVSFAPRLPTTVSEAEFRVPFGAGYIRGAYGGLKQGGMVELRCSDQVKASLRLASAPRSWIDGHFMLEPGVYARLWDESGNMKMASARGIDDLLTTAVPNAGAALPANLSLATPRVRDGLASLAGPSHRILTGSEVKRTNPSAEVLLDAVDPEGDDVGPGGYLYPTTPSLKAGSLDITRCTISADSANLYVRMTFRNLSDPGWHPEYGFQLTYVAIAIDEDGLAGSGRRTVGMNAQYELRPRDAYEKLILVGGGLRVEDTSAVLAEYIPQPGDERDPLGSVNSKTVAFSIPVGVIGRPSKTWRYSVLVGAQDDHGGAGLGEFRAVGRSAGEWSGGGKKDPAGTNVFDTILPRE